MPANKVQGISRSRPDVNDSNCRNVIADCGPVQPSTAPRGRIQRQKSLVDEAQDHEAGHHLRRRGDRDALIRAKLPYIVSKRFTPFAS